MIIRTIRNLIRDLVFEAIGKTYHFYIYLKQDRSYFKDLARGISHENVLYQVPPTTDKICIFVLFQRDEIPNHVLVQLNWINKLGYSTHIVSNAPIDQESLEKLKNSSFKITVRPNIGYDFGAYQHGVKDFLKNHADQASRLMLMNDSIFFPLLDPTELYQKVDSRNNDFWGWTENWQIHYHVASYGVVFKQKTFLSSAFNIFWKKYKPFSNRKHAINNGEVELTKVLLKSNLQPDTAIRTIDTNQNLNNLKLNEIRYHVHLTSDLPLVENGIERTSIIKFDHQFSKDFIQKVFDKYNISHQALLLANNLINFPILKKDLVYKDIFLQGKLLSNLKIDESLGITIDEIDAFFRKRGRLVDQRGNFFKRILAARGYH